MSPDVYGCCRLVMLGKFHKCVIWVQVLMWFKILRFDRFKMEEEMHALKHFPFHSSSRLIWHSGVYRQRCRSSHVLGWMWSTIYCKLRRSAPALFHHHHTQSRCHGSIQEDRLNCVVYFAIAKPPLVSIFACKTDHSEIWN